MDDRHPPHRGFLVGKEIGVVRRRRARRRAHRPRRPAAPGENGELVATDPERFGLPKYVARHGWVTYYLDLPGRPVDWDEVAELVQESYVIQAPTRPRASLGRLRTSDQGDGRAVAGRFRCPVRRGGQPKQVDPFRRNEVTLASARPTYQSWMTMDHLAARTSCTRETARSNGGLTKTTARWTPRSSRDPTRRSRAAPRRSRGTWPCRPPHRRGRPGHPEEGRRPGPPGRLTPSPTVPARAAVGAEAADDNGWRRLGLQEAVGAPAVPSPHRPQRGDVVGYRRPAASIAKDHTPQRFLLGGVGGVASPPAPTPSSSRPPLSS